MTSNLNTFTTLFVSTLLFACGGEDTSTPTGPDTSGPSTSDTANPDSSDTGDSTGSPDADDADGSADGDGSLPDQGGPPLETIPPMGDPGNPCTPFIEIDGAWVHVLTRNQMDVDCIPLMDQMVCEVSFSGDGAHIRGTYIGTELPLVHEFDESVVFQETGARGWWELTVMLDEEGQLLQILEYDDIGGKGTVSNPYTRLN